MQRPAPRLAFEILGNLVVAADAWAESRHLTWSIALPQQVGVIAGRCGNSFTAPQSAQRYRNAPLVLAAMEGTAAGAP